MAGLGEHDDGSVVGCPVDEAQGSMRLLAMMPLFPSIERGTVVPVPLGSVVVFDPFVDRVSSSSSIRGLVWGCFPIVLASTARYEPG